MNKQIVERNAQITPQIMRILKKLYHYENRYYGKQNETLYNESTLSEKERNILNEHHWKANDIVHFTDHNDILAKLNTLKSHPTLSEKRCLDAFIAGVGGSYPRGLSALPAWYYLEHCLPHSYDGREPFACCWVCGGKNETVCLNNAMFQYCLYLGNAYSSDPMYAYLNLMHLTEVSAVEPTKDDVITLSALLNLLRNAPIDETPGKLEKRLQEAKILKGDKYTKRGILNTLALVGVIPNQVITLSNKKWTNWGDIAICEKQLSNTKGRSDMEMPWAGWIGSQKLNEQRVDELFGEYLRSTVV
jgi:hypothetical protein